MRVNDKKPTCAQVQVGFLSFTMETFFLNLTLYTPCATIHDEVVY